MKTLNRRFAVLTALLLSLIVSSFVAEEKPVFYLIGDSTVAHGWGNYLTPYFIIDALSIKNRAVAGTSSRTYLTQGVHDKEMLKNGMWEGVMKDLKPGDFVIMQFGHNDNAPLDDTSRSRGSIKGTGEDSAVVYNRFLKKNETVHSYGWYISRFIRDAQSRGAIAIVCSPIPQDKWAGSKVKRTDEDYGKWAAETARSNGAFFIDLNALVADLYDKEGQEHVSASYFSADHVHTSADGSALNARMVVAGIGKLKKCKLRQYLK